MSSLAVIEGLLDEWRQGNFWALGPLLSTEVHASWGDPSGQTVCDGPSEIALRFRDFITDWEDFSVRARRVEQLDSEHVLVTADTRGTGKRSRLSLDAESFMLFAFAGEKIVGFHWYFDREQTFAAAGLEV